MRDTERGEEREDFQWKFYLERSNHEIEGGRDWRNLQI